MFFKYACDLGIISIFLTFSALGDLKSLSRNDN